MDSMIYTRIKELCVEKHITINRLESELGMSPASISKWRHSVSPTVEKLLKVANYFEVSLDYLVGLSNVQSSAEKILKDQDAVTLQRVSEKLSDRDRVRMMQLLKLVFETAFAEEAAGAEDPETQGASN